MDLQSMTPTEIDTQLAKIHGRINDCRDRLDRRKDELKRAEKAIASGRRSWYTPEEVTAMESKIEALTGEMFTILEETVPLQAEFTRRGGWTRFFLVPGGHVHSSMSCSTCNNGAQPTRFGWLPEWSGRSEEEALAALVGESEKTVLCTVCYPSAPVEWTQTRETVCPGTGTVNYSRETAKFRYSGGSAECGDCGQWTTLTKTRVLRKHKGNS